MTINFCIRQNIHSTDKFTYIVEGVFFVPRKDEIVNIHGQSHTVFGVTYYPCGSRIPGEEVV